MKKPAPSRDGWYEAIMQRALHARNSLLSRMSPRWWFGYTAGGVGELAGVEIRRCELVPPVIADAVGGLAAQLARKSNDQNLWMSLGGAREKWAHLPEDDLKVQ
ncbi:hypothetical protein [Mycobacterium avium]|uniref:hypothetical protein n=1 Tax=Mycobacterium avium TaxID=1764 RepID=UPI0015E0E147|nr:hypothetical protein [Mycobacterium avium]